MSSVFILGVGGKVVERWLCFTSIDTREACLEVAKLTVSKSVSGSFG